MKRNFYWIIALFCVTFCASCKKQQNVPEQPQGFFSTEINRLIDANYPEVEKVGYAELRVPANLFDQKAFAMPADAAGDMDYVVNAGYVAYVNGGSVRDAIMGKVPNDVDFTTDATPDQLVEIVPNTTIFTAPSGFIVAQAWHGDECTDMGTMRSIYEYLRGKPRIPESQYEGIFSKSLLEDSYSRDLTINAIYYDYVTGDLLDYHGGLHDLREGIIRSFIDPDLAYPQNPSSLLRTVRFAARFNFTIEPVTEAGIYKHLPECDALGASGIAYSVSSGFHDGNMTLTYSLYKKYGILGRYFLTLSDTLDTEDYNAYAGKVYAYLDAQKCNTVVVNEAALFAPVVQTALAGKTVTADEVTATWTRLEQESGQDQWYEIDEEDKADMCQLWYLLSQMSSDDVINDSAKAAQVRAAEQFGNAVILLNAMAQADSRLSKYTAVWN